MRSCRWSGSTASKRRPSSGDSRRSFSDGALAEEVGGRVSATARPFAAMSDPEIDGVAEQNGRPFIGRAEPTRHRLRRRILGIDAVNDLFELEGRKGPVDRGTRGLDGVALAAKLLRDPPADLEAGPDRRKERTDPAHELSGGFLFHGKHAEAVQHPVSGH